MRRAALLALVLALPSGAAGAASLSPDPAAFAAPMSVGRLAGGGGYIVRPSGGPAVAAIELWYRAPATGYGEKPIAALSRLAAQTVAASVPITGRELSKVVSDVGGRLNVTAYADAVSISALVPSSAAAAIVRTMSAVFFSPVVTAEGLRRAQLSVTQETLRESFDPDAVMRAALFARLFASGPAHESMLGAKPELAKIALETVRDYAARAFRAENAVLVVTGAVDRSVVAGAVAGRAGSAQAEAPIDSTVALPGEPAQKDFYEPGVGLGWLGPPISDERAATALDFIADYLCRPESGKLANAISKADPESSVFGQFITLHNPGVLVIQVAATPASKLDQTKMRAFIDDAVAGLQKPLPAAEFAAARAAFAYHLLSDLQTPLELADNFGWYTIEGNAPYAPLANGESGAYFQAIASLTPEYVAAVAHQYLARPGAVVSLAVAPPAPSPAPKGK